MAKPKRNEVRTPQSSGTWPIALAATAAAGRADGGVGLQQLVHDAGFADEPAMTLIVKRPRPRAEKGRIVDPYVDDVLDALRALCA